MIVASATVVRAAATDASMAAQLLADAAGDLAGAPPGSRARRPAALPALPPGELVVTVKVNGEDQGEAIVYQDPERGLMAERADLTAWRIATPEMVELRDGVEYVALGEVPGIAHQFDRRTNLLTLRVDPSQFVREQRALYDLAMPRYATPGLGAFANYGVDHRQAADDGQTNGYLELGGFGAFGVLTSDWAISAQGERRLNTTLTKDSPSRIATLRLGDFVGRNTTFGGGLALGGLQWATNFATRPGLMPIPLQRFQGQVSVPSTVEIFVNGVPTYRTEVQPGPFTITDIPVVSGGGTVEMVITDTLGRRQVVSNPFYATPSVLRGGLSEYAYELGALRVPNATGDALVYDDRPVARASHRRGLTDTFTGELLLEGMEDRATAGAALAWLVPGSRGVLRLGVAGSAAARDGQGQQGVFGYELARNQFSVSYEVRHETAGFARIGGLPADPLHSRDVASLALGYHDKPIGSFALALRRDRNFGPTDAEVATLTWNRGFGDFLTVSLSASHDRLSGDSSAFANLSLPLGGRTNLSGSHAVESPADDPASSQSAVNLQRNLDSGPSWGYRLGAAQGGDATAELAGQTASLTARLGAERVAGVESTSLALSGGLALVDGSLHASRQIGAGFALVRIPGAAGIGVYSDNAFVGRTDADGERLIPNLVPYRPTKVALDVNDLPLEVQLATDTLEVTGAYRAAALLEFPADLTRAYVATLVRRDGRPVPAGAQVWFDDADAPEPIGSEGFLYLAMDPGPHRLVARWADSECTVSFTVGASDDPQPDLGRLLCEEVAR